MDAQEYFAQLRKLDLTTETGRGERDQAIMDALWESFGGDLEKLFLELSEFRPESETGRQSREVHLVEVLRKQRKES